MATSPTFRISDRRRARSPSGQLVAISKVDGEGRSHPDNTAMPAPRANNAHPRDGKKRPRCSNIIIGARSGRARAVSLFAGPGHSRGRLPSVTGSLTSLPSRLTTTSTLSPGLCLFMLSI